MNANCKPINGVCTQCGKPLPTGVRRICPKGSVRTTLPVRDARAKPDRMPTKVVKRICEPNDESKRVLTGSIGAICRHCEKIIDRTDQVCPGPVRRCCGG